MAKGGQASILAVAYSDVNGNGKFDGNKELIADLVDTNHDKTVSVGDTVVFGTYPLHVDGTAGRGTFTQTTETITILGSNDANNVNVETAAGVVTWFHDSVTGLELFQTQTHTSETGVIFDSLIGRDGINDWSGGPGGRIRLFVTSLSNRVTSHSSTSSLRRGAAVPTIPL